MSNFGPSTTIGNNNLFMQDFPFSMNTGPAFQMQNTSQPISFEETARVFNTSLIATRSENTSACQNDIVETMKTPSFNAILVAVRYLAQSENISESEAAEKIISTFRKSDRAWSDYVYSEGLNRIRGTQLHN